MSHWTDSAKARLEAFLNRVRQGGVPPGADAGEVADDLRRHVIAEVAARRLSVVTEQDVDQIVARVGMPEAPLARESAPPSGPARESQKPRVMSGLARTLTLIFGILLPLGTVVFEVLTGACAGVLFDPTPTIGHTLLTLWVPLANLAVWLAVHQGGAPARSWLAWGNGIAVGISLVYALLFLPVTPVAVVGIIVYGFGLVPLAPLCSFITALYLRGALRRLTSPDRPLPGLWRGASVGAGLLALLTLPLLLTSLGLQMAVSESESESRRGISWLRAAGDREEILRACYGRSGQAGEIYRWGRPINPETARGVYYRVTGQPFNTVPPPPLYAGRARWSVMEQEFTWDNDQGGDAVAGRVKGLSLASSKQDGFIDPDGALAYLEWTMEFRNDSRLQREARAQIALPPGGVVSRLTLWIEGEEREAAFGGRSQVKTAYKAVVAQRRDPVLVTTCGPDRVLMQCFPVPPNGGRMKVRVGISAPLVLTNAETGLLAWPRFLERNFSLNDGFSHTVWIDATREIRCGAAGLIVETARPGTTTLRGSLHDRQLGQPENVIRVARTPGTLTAWTQDSRGDGTAVVQQSLTESPLASPGRVIIVLDGTEGMEKDCPAIARGIESLPPGLEFAVLLARDGVDELSPLLRSDEVNLERAATRLRRLSLQGGHDNVAALTRAWEMAAGAPGGVILWIHGPQPMLLDNAESLRQRFERRAGPPVLVSFPIHSGPNRVLERLDGLGLVREAFRCGPVTEDLRSLLAQWNGKGRQWTCHRQRLDGTTAGEGAKTSLHLARLWAADQVVILHQARRNDEAMKLAGAYQLVTPVSGAVVLENQVQYQQAGLQPVAAESVPSVPEPSAGALLLLAAAMMLLLRRRIRPANQES